MSSLASLPRTLSTLLTTTADALGRSTGCIQREVKFSGATLAQTLVFGWLGTPAGSLDQLCQMAASCGVAISPQGLDERLTETTATFLQALLAAAIGEVIATDPVAVPLLGRFTGVYLQDCSALTLPAALASVWAGCGDSTPTGHRGVVKLGVRLDLCRGTLQGPVLAPGRTHDRVVARALPALPPGSLRLADLGFFALKDLAAQSDAGCFWLTRVQTGTQVVDADDRALPLSQFLAEQETSVVDVPVRLGKTVRLPCRLLAIAAPPAVVEQRTQRLQQDRHRRRQPVTTERRALLHWTVLATNVPAARLSHTDAFVLYRARWQIENCHPHYPHRTPWSVLGAWSGLLVVLMLPRRVDGLWYRAHPSLVALVPQRSVVALA